MKLRSCECEYKCINIYYFKDQSQNVWSSSINFLTIRFRARVTGIFWFYLYKLFNNKAQVIIFSHSISIYLKHKQTNVFRFFLNPLVLIHKQAHTLKFSSSNFIWIKLKLKRIISPQNLLIHKQAHTLKFSSSNFIWIKLKLKRIISPQNLNTKRCMK